MSVLVENNNKYFIGLENKTSDTKKIKQIDNELEKEKLIIISWLEWVNKTEIISNFIKKTNLTNKTLYFNTKLDIFSKIKEKKDLERMLVFYKKSFWEPEVIVLEKIQKIKDVNIFIKNLYLTNKYKIILIWNNIKISNKPEIEILPNYLSDDILLKDKITYWSLDDIKKIDNINLKNKVLNLLLNKIMLEDIFYTFDVRNIDLYQTTLSILASNNDFISLRDFNKFLKRYNVKISLATTIDYIDYSLSAKIIKKISNFDLKLRKEILHKNKYFFTDIWIKNSILLTKINNYIVTENHIYNIFSLLWYSIYWWISWVFKFSFLISSEKESDIYSNIKFLIHITQLKTREEIQWEARKLIKTNLECEKYIIIQNNDNMNKLNLRKLYRWVNILKLEEFIRIFPEYI